MSSNSKNKRENSKLDDFVSSMTFASSFGYGFCYCSDDECGRCPDKLPGPIAEAVRNYKRSRTGSSPFTSMSNDGSSEFAIPLIFSSSKPRQERQLIARHEGISFWKLTMPQDAEPLIEYGSSHRLVYVKQLPRNSKLISIGRGIYGSSMEEKERIDMKWKNKGWYLVPSNGGKSIGWIHKGGKEENKAEVSVDSEAKGDAEDEKKILLLMVNT